MPDALREWINPLYLEPGRIKRLSRTYTKAKPFPHLSLSAFLREGKAAKLQKALKKERFTRKESDLFSLEQTSALESSKDPVIRGFLALLKNKEFLGWITTITGENLSGEVDAHGTRYSSTDYLLCHDDRLEGRKIAYILYLSKGFTSQSGGALALLNSDRKDRPKKVKKQILPEWNAFAFFGVTKKSHHMVEEVLERKERLTAGGWFHG